jgi:hypothetical protein
MQTEKRKIEDSAVDSQQEKKVKIEGTEVPLITPVRTPSPSVKMETEETDAKEVKVEVANEADGVKEEEIKVESVEVMTIEADVKLANEANVEVKQEASEQGKEKQEGKADKLPKRKCAVLMGYCGKGYQGMQMYALIQPLSAHSVVTPAQRPLKRRSTRPSKPQVS